MTWQNTWRGVLLLALLGSMVGCVYLWMWGSAYKERAEILEESKRILMQLSADKQRYGALARSGLEQCEYTLEWVAKSLGQDPKKGILAVVRSLPKGVRLPGKKAWGIGGGK